MQLYIVCVDEVRSNNNVVYRCTYHVVWCPKYRRKVIEGDIDTRLKAIIREVCAEREASIVDLETMPDHVHLLVSCDPQYGIHRLVKQIKGRSSRLLRQEFPTLKSRIPTLWTNSYFVATVGGATLEVIKEYVENQRNA
ncbi:IS200/IS605 family transposase [Rhodococcus sp. BH5]|uniref:IS200/IS605 family transposase n=1 Tax=Rhodococcus sp. BH5 TaxID=2871702 RepID=UPI0022CDB087|nr:IS200/IS605 family transposase [Rhodococcus sp. BH5]MCZ9634975.1 IS200/IS605 family transposase [Rhodococcus sp. BH5]